MNEKTFKSEMQRADVMRKTVEPEKSPYWAGYIRGLRRNYHGDKFGTELEHLKWQSLEDERGQGYRDGVNFGR